MQSTRTQALLLNKSPGITCPRCPRAACDVPDVIPASVAAALAASGSKSAEQSTHTQTRCYEAKQQPRCLLAIHLQQLHKPHVSGPPSAPRPSPCRIRGTTVAGARAWHQPTRRPWPCQAGNRARVASQAHARGSLSGCSQYLVS